MLKNLKYLFITDFRLVIFIVSSILWWFGLSVYAFVYWGEIITAFTTLILIVWFILYCMAFVIYLEGRQNELPKYQFIIFKNIFYGSILAYFFMGFTNNIYLNKRKHAGRVIVNFVENYKTKYGQYPINLEVLNQKSILSKQIPVPFLLKKFDYSVLKEGNNFILSIPEPFFDRYVWNNKKQDFEYKDW